MLFIRILLTIMITFGFVDAVLAAEESSPMQKLDSTVEEALQMTKSYHYTEAKQLLNDFSEKFTKSAILHQTFTMDDIRILTVAHHQALRALNSTSMNHEQRVDEVTTFRLVVDALTSRYQPLWSEMKEPVLTAFQHVKEAAKIGNKEVYRQTVNQFLEKYSIIEPSLRVDIPVEEVQKLDAKIQYIDQYSVDNLKKKEAVSQLNDLQSDLQKLFDRTEEDEADPSLWWVIISTGSIIIGTLSYVGWRKYKGEKEEKKPRKQKD
ncbi:sporulation protein YpjB [Bacillus sp. FSL W8-1127]|uniref:sporulation protein YpjB n=1 Tax=unclassified Bacillus (in: firmicutes) TaxID=185979 RepID=UPI0030F76DA8